MSGDEFEIVGKPYAVKAARTVWVGGKDGDYIKVSPIYMSQPLSDTKTCPSCLGSGNVKCPICGYGRDSCKKCHGEGKIVCHMCGGTGKIFSKGKSR